MKKWFFIFLLCAVLFPAEAHSQAVWKKAFWKKIFSAEEESARRAITVKQANKLLLERKRLSLKKAQQVCSGEIGECMLDGEAPVHRIKGWPFSFSQSGPYEDNELFQTLSRSAKRNYFIAAHNRAVSRTAVARRNALKRMNEAKEDLMKGFYSPTAVYPGRELVSIVQEKHKYIFLGETHGFPVIQEAIKDFLQEYRLRFPKRQIILLTEFLPNTQTAAYRWKLRKFPQYYSIWQIADILKIPVVGLDPVWLLNKNFPVMWVNKPNGTTEKEKMWFSPEVLRVRNLIWKKEIDRLRSQYPDAVFIFHTGATHVTYTESFSLSVLFPKDETFVATFQPYEIYNNQPARSDLLDAFNPEQFASKRFIVWPNPDMARIAGFDARFKLQ